ncbi:MAG: response regulator [Gemmatimonadota bacterium]
MTAEPVPPTRPDLGRDRPCVLIANDQEWAARSLGSLLEAEGFRVVRSFTGARALEQARKERPDLVVLDRQMPDVDGLEICRRLRSDPEFGPSLPVIITTAGPSGRATRMEAHKAGAWVFHGSPLDTELLLAQIRAFLAAKPAAGQAPEENLADPETGLYSARGLLRRAKEILSGPGRRGPPFACVILTPDLRESSPHVVAQRLENVLRRASRSADAIGRLGETQFGIVAPATGKAGAERLVSRLEGLFQADGEGGDRPGALRAGYVVSSGLSELLSPEEMLSRAWSALELTDSDDRIRAA